MCWISSSVPDHASIEYMVLHNCCEPVAGLQDPRVLYDAGTLDQLLLVFDVAY